VYSFGVVLLEMITGRRAMDRSLPPEQHNLVDWSRQFFSDRRRLFRLLDPRLEGQYSIKGARKAAILAQTCLHRDPRGAPRHERHRGGPGFNPGPARPGRGPPFRLRLPLRAAGPGQLLREPRGAAVSASAVAAPTGSTGGMLVVLELGWGLQLGLEWGLGLGLRLGLGQG